MSDFQKVIKYIAIVFGMYLALQILIAIIIGITSLAGAFTGWEKEETRENMELVSEEQTYEEIQNVKIQLAVSDLQIQEGAEWKVEVVDMPKEFVQKKSGDTLTLSDENIKNNWFHRLDTTPFVKITIPEGMELEKVSIETGIGNTNVKNVICDTFVLSQGVGNVTIHTITCNKMEIDGGAGKFELENVLSQSCKVRAGVGKTRIQGRLEGSSKIEAGVGEMQLALEGTKEAYAIRPETGIGAIYIDGNKVEGNKTYGEGSNKIRLEGGMGKVDITFME